MEHLVETGINPHAKIDDFHQINKEKGSNVNVIVENLVVFRTTCEKKP